MSAKLSDPIPAPDAAFIDAAGCARWLKTVALINAAPAHCVLTTRLVALNAVDIDSEERLAILETLRQPVVFVQAEVARAFRGKPLPLAGADREVFRTVVVLWDALARGYDLAIQGLAGNVFASVTLALQRALDTVARKLLDHHLAHVQVAPDTYASLHRVYRIAEKLSRAGEKVPDPLFHASELTTCTRTWVRALLLDAAGTREQRARQILLVNRLLEHWAPRVTVLTAAPDAPENPPLLVNLDEPRGATPAAAATSGLRVLEVSALAKTVLKRVIGLRRGVALAKLGLPEDCAQPGCEALLVALFRHWCEGGPRRAHARTASNGKAEVCLGLPAAHYYLAGRPFYPPDNPPTLDGEAYRLKRGIMAETWLVRDESAGGMGLERPAALGDTHRIELGQMLLVRPEGSGGLLATVQWMQETDAGDLLVGAQFLAAQPQPVAVRLAGDARWQPALLLPSVLNIGPTLVLPPGSFGPGRAVEIYTETLERRQIVAFSAQGTDFERLAVAPFE